MEQTIIVELLSDMKLEVEGQVFWRHCLDFDVYHQFLQEPPTELVQRVYHTIYAIHWSKGERLQLNKRSMALMFDVCAEVWKLSSQDEQLAALGRARKHRQAWFTSQ